MMKMSSSFELIQVADDYLAIPIGEAAMKSRDVFTFSKAAAFLLDKLKEPRSKDDLVALLVSEYDIDTEKAKLDIDAFLENLHDTGLLE